MTEVLLAITIILLLINLWCTFQLKKINNSKAIEQFAIKMGVIEANILKSETTFKEEFVRNREEANRNAREAREETAKSVKNFGDSMLSRMVEIASLQKNQLDTFSNQLNCLTRSNSEHLESMRETIATQLKALQEDNSKKIEKMRETVDEKLHKTLEQRLGESFKLVSDRLELVHKGLGEMQSLATGVGDLKKVLSNVKTRGILGEIQLGNILEQLLTPEQYSKNIATKKGSRENVEFAIKLPGQNEPNECVYLPIDSKFPLEIYHHVVDAYEKGDQSGIESATKNLDNCIKKNAKDIRDKYIDPPNTTDFGIMFLPIEGLYAEVVRRPSLIEALQRDYKIIITGPTTLAALLNSLQMGFKTLAIEKHSSEVWKVLGAVKTEFKKFGDVLGRAQDKINQASNEMDTLVGVRTRQIQRKLSNIQEISMQEGTTHLKSESTVSVNDKNDDVDVE
ncbi:MAG: DNA recombination protein RmuC [Clostridia bacterium]|nr:DNA recombination protein RmuC [Clostridia bacterium]MDD4049310.1 DNA recombination protein RmuC [Clostridia bacterium]